MAAQVISI